MSDWDFLKLMLLVVVLGVIIVLAWCGLLYALGDIAAAEVCPWLP